MENMSFPAPSRNLSYLPESGASQCVAPTNEGQIRLVARMQRSGMRDNTIRPAVIPDCASAFALTCFGGLANPP